MSSYQTPLEVKLSHKNAIYAARSAYSGLTENQKRLVTETSRNKLTEVETALGVLEDMLTDMTVLYAFSNKTGTEMIIQVDSTLDIHMG